MEDRFWKDLRRSIERSDFRSGKQERHVPGLVLRSSSREKHPCMSTVGKAINVTSKVTAALLLVWMDLTCCNGISLFDPSNALVEFNRKLHSNALITDSRLL